MNWNCTQTEERLSDYLDGIFDPAEAAQFSAHVARCPNCTKLVAQVGGLVAQMRELLPVEEPHDLVRKILDATLGTRTPERASSRWLAWLPSIWEPRFAMGIVTVAASIMIVLHATAAKTGKTELNPANLFHAANRQVHLTYARSTKFVNDLRVVYQIQSRLTSSPDSMSEPAPAPSSEPQPHDQHPNDPPPSSEPREKSQTTRRSERSGSRNTLELADLATTADLAPDRPSHSVLRRQL
jgi:hypothetical protein